MTVSTPRLYRAPGVALSRSDCGGHSTRQSGSKTDAIARAYAKGEGMSHPRAGSHLC